jgi:hypothetical protein
MDVCCISEIKRLFLRFGVEVSKMPLEYGDVSG